MRKRARAFGWLALLAVVMAVAGAGASARSGHPRAAHRGAIVQLAASGSCVAQNTEETTCAQGKALVAPRGVVASPDGKDIYVAASGGESGDNAGVAEFRRDASSGRLNEVGCVTTAGTNGEDTTNGACADGDGLADTSYIAMSPDGANVYVSAPTSNAIDVFKRDPATGALSQTACIQHSPPAKSRCINDFPLEGPTAIAVSPDGKFAYVGANVSFFSGVVTYARDPGTGMLHELSCVSDDGNDGICSTGKALIGVTSLVASPDGRNLYATSNRGFSEDGTLAEFDRDGVTGALTETECFVEGAPHGSVCHQDSAITGANAVVISPDGSNVYVAAPDDSTVSGFTRNASDGRLARGPCASAPEDTSDDEGAAAPTCSTATGLSGVSSLALSPDGTTLYAGSQDDSALVTLRRTGAGGLESTGCTADTDSDLAGCSPAQALGSPEGVAVSPDGANVYVSAFDSDALSVFGSSVGVSSSRARLHGSRFAVTLVCPASMPHACTGALRVLRPGARRRGHRHARARVAARRGYAVARSSSARVDVALPRALVRAVQRHGRVTLLVEASQRSGDRQPTARLVTVTR